MNQDERQKLVNAEDLYQQNLKSQAEQNDQRMAR